MKNKERGLGIMIEVREQGIVKVTPLSETERKVDIIIPREVFIEAYDKFINNKDNTQATEVKMSITKDRNEEQEIKVLREVIDNKNSIIRGLTERIANLKNTLKKINDKYNLAINEVNDLYSIISEKDATISKLESEVIKKDTIIRRISGNAEFHKLGPKPSITLSFRPGRNCPIRLDDNKLKKLYEVITEEYPDTDIIIDY